MAITRRKFTLEFRTEAAHRVIDTGRSVRAVASPTRAALDGVLEFLTSRLGVVKSGEA